MQEYFADIFKTTADELQQVGKPLQVLTGEIIPRINKAPYNALQSIYAGVFVIIGRYYPIPVLTSDCKTAERERKPRKQKLTRE